MQVFRWFVELDENLASEIQKKTSLNVKDINFRIGRENVRKSAKKIKGKFGNIRYKKCGNMITNR